MNIHKRLMRLALTVSALFWASCDDDTSVVAPESSPVSSASVQPVSSSDAATSSAEEAVSSAAEIANSSAAVLPASSSSVVPVGSSASVVDTAAARARGEEFCANHGGLMHGIQYEPPWGDPETRAQNRATFQVEDEVKPLLASDSVSETRKQCLRSVLADLTGGLAVMYGSPMFNNPNDIWMYECNDGEIVMDEKYAALKAEDDAEVNASMVDILAEMHKKVEACDE